MKRIIILIIGFMLISATVFAGSGDLIVNGKLGIGTTGPQRLTEWQAAQPIIRLSGNAAEDDDVGMVEFHNRATGGGGVGAYLTGYRSGANNSIGFNFVTLDAGTNIRPMVILPGGNVGIGTTNPGKKLSVGPNLHAAGDGIGVDGVIQLSHGTGVPTPVAGTAYIWLDSADGTLKVKFSTGTVKTLATP